MRVLTTVFAAISRFVLFLGMPVYGVYYGVRRRFVLIFGPAKNRFMAIVTNRFLVHFVLAMIVVGVGVLNLQTTQVRAEAFGEKSMLYRLVGPDAGEVIEEYATEYAAIEVVPVHYRETFALQASLGVDDIGFGDSDGFSLIGGSIISAPAARDGDSSVAPRERVEMYVVESGDTLSTIAEAFGISLDTLLWANDLSVRSVLGLGDELVILPVSGVRHVVKSGDTLSTIANTYSVTQTEILDRNALASANMLSIGDELLIPGGKIVAAAPVSRSEAISQVLSPTPTAVVSAPVSSGVPATTTGYMIWPTELSTITQYYGWRHTGLDIDCGYTHDNFAALDGIVEYSGWRGGYGYTVEVNHGNGMMTRYAHHSSNYVVAGQAVSQGQPIGRCGSTGRSTGTHIHFEVIVNGRFKNPLEYIR